MIYDSIIIGGGPAGLTAGIYLARANKKILILEKESIGGQIGSSPLVENYPGFVSIPGYELTSNLYEQVEKLNIQIELEEAVKIIDGNIKKVITDYNEYQTKTIIIATGAKYKSLGIDNETNLIGSGIHFCATCDGSFYKDKVVAVIGRGNTAVGNAIYLSKLCKKVYLVNYKDKLNCEEILLNKLKKLNNIEILFNSKVTKINGNNKLESILINDKLYEIDGMFVSIGLEAQTKLVSDLLNLNEKNYVKSEECLTNIDGIFVAGDCRDKKVRQLTTAVNDGTISATLVIDYLDKELVNC